MSFHFRKLLIELIPSAKGNCISILQTLVNTEAVVGKGIRKIIMLNVKVTEEIVCVWQFAACN